MAKLRKDDPLYYKETMKKLIREAEENGLNVYYKESHTGTMVYFKNDIGECAGVYVKPE